MYIFALPNKKHGVAPYERKDMFHTSNASLDELVLEGLDARLSSIGLFGRGEFSWRENWNENDKFEVYVVVVVFCLLFVLCLLLVCLMLLIVDDVVCWTVGGGWWWQPQ